MGKGNAYLQISTVKHDTSRYKLPLQQTPQHTPKRTDFKPTGTTRNNSIEKELANKSAYPIQYVNVVI
jgi:hypothetical protein